MHSRETLKQVFLNCVDTESLELFIFLFAQLKISYLLHAKNSIGAKTIDFYFSSNESSIDLGLDSLFKGFIFSGLVPYKEENNKSKHFPFNIEIFNKLIEVLIWKLIANVSKINITDLEKLTLELIESGFTFKPFFKDNALIITILNEEKKYEKAFFIGVKSEESFNTLKNKYSINCKIVELTERNLLDFFKDLPKNKQLDVDKKEVYNFLKRSLPNNVYLHTTFRNVNTQSFSEIRRANVKTGLPDFLFLDETMVNLKYLDIATQKKIYGLMIVSDNLSSRKIDQLRHKAEKEVAELYPVLPGSMLLVLKNSEYANFKNSFTRVTSLTKKNTFAPAFVRNDQISQVTTSTNNFDGINGPQIVVSTKYRSGREEKTILDMGLPTDFKPEMTFDHLLKNGKLILENGIYEMGCLTEFIENNHLKMNENDPLFSFVLRDIILRVGKENVISLFDTKKRKLVKKLTSIISTYENKNEQESLDFLLAILITHNHTDHLGALSSLRPSNLGCSPYTYMSIAQDYTKLVKDTYPHFSVLNHNFLPMYGDGSQINLGTNTSVRSYKVLHSTHSLGYRLSVFQPTMSLTGYRKELASIGYAGDYNDPYHLKEIFANTNLAFYDGTRPTNNIPDLTFEKNILAHYSEIILEHKKEHSLLVIEMVKNDFDLVNNLIEIAKSFGQTIVLSARLAKRLHNYSLVLSSNNQDSLKIPDLNNPMIKILKKPDSVLLQEDFRIIYQLYGEVSSASLIANGGQYILLREEGEDNREVSELLTPLTYVHGPHNRRSYGFEAIARSNGWRSRENPGRFGHANTVDRGHDLEGIGTLAQILAMNMQKLCVVHSYNRKLVHQYIETFSKPFNAVTRNGKQIIVPAIGKLPLIVENPSKIIVYQSEK